MNDSDNAFKSDKADFRRLAGRTLDMAATHLETIDTAAVDRAMPTEARRVLLDQPLREDGMSADEILDFLAAHVVPWPLPTGHRRSYGWVNSPPAPIGILADTLATCLNSTSDGYDHSGVFLQSCFSRWLMELLDFPIEGSMGLLLSGGSACNLNALTVARHRAASRAGYDIRQDGLQSIDRRLLVYCSGEAHSSIQKCVETLGLGARAIRTIDIDSKRRARPEALAQLIEADLAAGHLPCAVVGLAGTTNTGAIDPLGELAAICARHGVWFHVDGAYGALARLDPVYRDALSGLSLADSVTFNPHKWLMTPVDCGALLVRDKQVQREAFSLVPAYLEAGGTDEAPWQYHYSFQLTYANRAVKAWSTLARLGRKGVKELVVRMNRLADALGERLNASADFEMLSDPSLSVVCFRWRPPESTAGEAALDRLQSAISRRISESGEAHIPTSEVDGRTCLRACFMHYENDDRDLDHLLDLIRRHGAEVLAEE